MFVGDFKALLTSECYHSMTIDGPCMFCPSTKHSVLSVYPVLES